MGGTQSQQIMSQQQKVHKKIWKDQVVKKSYSDIAEGIVVMTLPSVCAVSQLPVVCICPQYIEAGPTQATKTKKFPMIQ